jgi:hypothetical protein
MRLKKLKILTNKKRLKNQKIRIVKAAIIAN